MFRLENVKKSPRKARFHVLVYYPKFAIFLVFYVPFFFSFLVLLVLLVGKIRSSPLVRLRVSSLDGKSDFPVSVLAFSNQQNGDSLCKCLVVVGRPC